MDRTGITIPRNDDKRVSDGEQNKTDSKKETVGDGEIDIEKPRSIKPNTKESDAR